MAEEGPDAIVVGAGPNGLAAAIALARAGRSVRVLEAEPEIGGGTRTAELTLPGFRHDVCSAIHPLTLASPALSALPLEEHGLRFVQPDLALAHPLDGGTAAALHRSVDDTAVSLGADAAAYRRLIGPAARDWRALMDDLLGPPCARPATQSRPGGSGCWRSARRPGWHGPGSPPSRRARWWRATRHTPCSRWRAAGPQRSR